MMHNAREKLTAMALMLREHVKDTQNKLTDPRLHEHISKLGTETGHRFTLITADGTVITDSQTGQKDIGPHGDRPEIREAISNDTGFANRESSTLKVPMIYLAIRFQREGSDKDEIAGFVRVAVPAEPINSAINSLQRYTSLFVISLSLLTGLLMVLFSTRMMRPLSLFADAARTIADGQYETIQELNSRDDEWGELAESFQQMQVVLTKRERGLKENSSRLEAVLSSMIEGVVAIDREGTVTLANGAACRMLSLAHPELVGRKLLDIARFPELYEAVQRSLQAQSFTKTEFTTLSDPRKTIGAQVSVLSDDEEPGVAIVMHDVTDLRKLETMRRDFVANVSHELKTPLSSIRAYAETLKLGAIDDPEKKISFLERIETQADILNRQIQDLIQLARVESAQTSFEIVAVDLETIGTERVQAFLSEADSRDIKIAFHCDQKVYAKADLEGVKTILNNLISNALHYTGQGGQVTVSVGQGEHQTIIEVTDTGIGISPEHQARVFERFYRVDKARSRDMGGTGLGLSIVKHLSQSFGGNVELNSQIGKGSTFTVHLPRSSATNH